MVPTLPSETKVKFPDTWQPASIHTESMIIDKSQDVADDDGFGGVVTAVSGPGLGFKRNGNLVLR